MAKYENNVEILKDNPHVFRVTKDKLKLKTASQIELFNVWKKYQDTMKVMDKLEEMGISHDAVIPSFCSRLIANFKQSGFPSIRSKDEALRFVEYFDMNPLLRSGKFMISRSGHSLVADPAFEQELLRVYPKVSVEDGLVLAGLDLLDVGYARIRVLRNRIEGWYGEAGKDKSMNDDLKGETETVKVSEEVRTEPDLKEAVNGEVPDEEKIMEDQLNAEEPAEDADGAGSRPVQDGLPAITHPYLIRYYRPEPVITVKNAFYNETYLLGSVPVEQMLKAYMIGPDMIGPVEVNRIRLRLMNWEKTPDAVNDCSEQMNMIQAGRLNLLMEESEKLFEEIRNRMKEASTAQRREAALLISELPDDPLGFFNVKRLYESCGFSKTVYYSLISDPDYGNWRVKKDRQDEADFALIRRVYEYKGFRKGYRQIYMMMYQVTGTGMGLQKIRRLMKKFGLDSGIRHKKKNRRAMLEESVNNKKPNLLNRRFRLFRPNQVRLTDVTYIDYGDGLRAYGSACIDPVTGRLICFVVSDRNDLWLAINTIRFIDEKKPEEKAIFHSDQGTLYMNPLFQKEVSEMGYDQSMSRRGNCWDNAPQESFWGHFKDECPYERCSSLSELKGLVKEYTSYYNEERHMWSREQMTPVQYERHLLSMSDEQYCRYLEVEEKAYEKMKADAKKKAIEECREYSREIREYMEELGNVQKEQ